MTPATCAATTRRGAPCRVPARSGSAFCPFHDPACAAAFTAGRRKGGSQPRPPAVNADRVLRLSFQLLAGAVQAPGRLDSDRLHDLSRLASTLLQATRSAGANRRSTCPHLPPSPAAGARRGAQQVPNKPFQAQRE